MTRDPYRLTPREYARQQRALAALGFPRRPRPILQHFLGAHFDRVMNAEH